MKRRFATWACSATENKNRRQRTVCSEDEEEVFSDDSEDFSLVSDVVDVVVRSEDEVVVTEVWETVSVTVTISFVWDVSVGTIVWIPESLSDRSATPDNVYEQQEDADVAGIPRGE